MLGTAIVGTLRPNPSLERTSTGMAPRGSQVYLPPRRWRLLRSNVRLHTHAHMHFRRLFLLVIALCVAYFVLGWIAAYFGWLTRDNYLLYAGFVGSLASVIGLVSLAKPSISRSDLENIESQNWEAIAESSKRLEDITAAKAKNKQELDNLEVKRQEMELLFRKASLRIFLAEQAAHHERVVLEELDRNPRLRQSLSEFTDASSKLSALEQEIAANPHVAELQTVLDSSRKRRSDLSSLLDGAPWYLRMLAHAADAIAKPLLLK